MGTVILLSGGADSLISWRVFYPDAQPVYVHTGNRYGHLDVLLARLQARKACTLLTELYADNLYEQADGVVPHRNAYLLAYVANATGADAIVVSAPRGEIIRDQQPAFHRSMADALGIAILNPLRKLTKAQAVARYLDEHPHTARENLSITRSCYHPTARRCGQCPACVKRYVSMELNNIDELSEYNVDPRLYGNQIASRAKFSDLFRYGLRPTIEAALVLR